VSRGELEVKTNFLSAHAHGFFSGYPPGREWKVSKKIKKKK
jgi:hypothetical protein